MKILCGYTYIIKVYVILNFLIVLFIRYNLYNIMFKRNVFEMSKIVYKYGILVYTYRYNLILFYCDFCSLSVTM